MNQAVKAIAEAEAYPGPSLIIGYAPCELHGVKGGMTNCQNEMKKAVEAGYWNLFTFNPANKAQGKNPFTLTSKAVDNEKYQALLANETRYSRLTLSLIHILKNAKGPCNDGAPAAGHVGVMQAVGQRDRERIHGKAYAQQGAVAVSYTHLLHCSEFGTFCAGQSRPGGAGEPQKGTIAHILY